MTENIRTAKYALTELGRLVVKFKSVGYRGEVKCTMYDGADRPLTSYVGGGCSLEGECLADFISIIFKDELIELDKTLNRNLTNGMSTGMECGLAGFYKAGDKVYLNGSCGLSEIMYILERLGYKMKWFSHNIYEITPIE